MTSQVERFTIVLDEDGKKIKMCDADCPCHQGARYDQIECRCEWYCGDNVD